MTDFERLDSPEDLENQFELDKPFSEEAPVDTVARLNWLATRQQAESIVFLREMGLDLRQTYEIMQLLTEIQCDFVDFIATGVEADKVDREDIEAASHPFEMVLRQVIQQKEEDMFAAIPLAELLSPERCKELELGTLSDEDLIKRLEKS